MSEVRVTDPDTGGAKGQKPQRFDLMPAPFLWELAEVYGMGAAKYEDDNWRKGYDWRLSYAALQRHVHLFWMGESNDSESGLHHLAHAAFHLGTLFTYDTRSIGRDTRPDAIFDYGLTTTKPHYTEETLESIRDTIMGQHVPITAFLEDNE